MIYGIDLWEEGGNLLKEEAAARGSKNIKAMVADVGERIPLEDTSIDVCFMATVFHDLVLAHTFEVALIEILRVLREDGALAILEFKKIDGPPGPPLSSRLAPEEVEKRLIPYGFERVGLKDIGPYNYLLSFQRL